jgi:hypothetical protein
MESVARRELHPIRHGISDIVAVSLTDGASVDDVVQDFEAILTGTLVTIFAKNAKISLRGWMGSIADAAGSHQKRTASLHDVEHLPVKGDLHHDLGRILGLKGGLIVYGSLGQLGTTSKKYKGK